MKQVHHAVAARMAVVFALSGCEGTIGDSEGFVDPHEDLLCQVPTFDIQPLARLSSEQYDNTLRDLLGPNLAPLVWSAKLFPETEYTQGFATDPDNNGVDTLTAAAIEENAESIANAILATPETFAAELLPCASSPPTEADVENCIGEFIDQFGKRAYRRPVNQSEKDRLLAVYTTIRDAQGGWQGFISIIQVLLQSPHHVYRIEQQTTPVPHRPGLVRLSDYEMASRLSYFLTQSMPDDALFAAADAGQLNTPEQVRSHALRLLNTPRATQTLAAFHRDWLKVYELDSAAKDTATFPNFTQSLRDELKLEVQHYVEHVMASGGDFNTLMTSSTIPVSSQTAPLYGTTTPGDFTPLSFAGARAGLLSLASVMASHAAERVPSLVERGAFVRRDIMCMELPPFPDNLDTTGPVEATAHLPTGRERYSPLMERAECAPCHQYFNTLGFPLEQYDAVGAHRTHENGVLIDPAGEFVFGNGDQIQFASPQELIQLLAQRRETQDCYSRQWFRKAMGRTEAPLDECAVEYVSELMAQSGGDLRNFLAELVASEIFLYRRLEQS